MSNNKAQHTIFSHQLPKCKLESKQEPQGSRPGDSLEHRENLHNRTCTRGRGGRSRRSSSCGCRRRASCPGGRRKWGWHSRGSSWSLRGRRGGRDGAALGIIDGVVGWAHGLLTDEYGEIRADLTRCIQRHPGKIDGDGLVWVGDCASTGAGLAEVWGRHACAAAVRCDTEELQS